MHHFNCAVNLSLCFKNRKSLTKPILKSGCKEIAKPLTNNFIAFVSQGVNPLLVYLNEVSIKIEGLIA